MIFLTFFGQFKNFVVKYGSKALFTSKVSFFKKNSPLMFSIVSMNNGQNGSSLIMSIIQFVTIDTLQ